MLSSVPLNYVCATSAETIHLIPLVPARVKERVKLWYPESHDEIYEGTDIPELLYKLKIRLIN